MFKRMFLFSITNVLIIATISVVAHFLGIDKFVSSYGLNASGLLAFCFLWGMTGSVLNLMLSRFLAKKLMRITLISPDTVIPEFRGLIDAVYSLAKSSGLKKMPEVGIYESDEINAFATGPSRNRSLVAISTGLALKMSAKEIYGVLGHEIAHISNGDMVTMTMLQGVINSFVMFFSRVLSFVITRNSNGGGSSVVRYYITFLFEIIFGLLGSIIVAHFSRYREFRADAGGSKLAGNDNMIMALSALLEQRTQSNNFVEQSGLKAFKIYGGESSLMKLLSTHPPISERISRLKKLN